MVNKHKKKSFLKFGIGMAIYAIVFLIAAAIGLSKFWDYIAAYEASRPENTMNAYMQQVDANYSLTLQTLRLCWKTIPLRALKRARPITKMVIIGRSVIAKQPVPPLPN